MKLLTLRKIAVLLLLFQIISCDKEDIDPENLIQEEAVKNHIERLASDEFLGRKPGTTGEDRTVQYIAEELKKSGVKSGNGNSYFQDFKIQKVDYIKGSDLHIFGENSQREYKFGSDYYATTSYKLNELVSIENVDMVYVGFGITAPRFKWDDYKNADFTGKIVVVLDNDPGYYSGDDTMFRGKKPSFYGSLKYKKREAAKRGAVGLIVVRDKAISQDDIDKIKKDASIFIEGESELASDGLKFSGFVSNQVMKDLMNLSKLKVDYVKEAQKKSFSVLPLKTQASLSVESKAKDFIKTKNVVGFLKGSKRPDEYIIYTAHWDHIGTRGSHLGKDSIFNGAIDNASGTAMQLEVAKAFSQLNNRPERSLIFLFTSAEEMGLLGAEHYANNPIYPLNKTAAVINADASFAVERMRMVVNVIQGYTSLDSLVDVAAEKLGRGIYKSDGNPPPNNVFMRSDHYPFVKKGVPAVWNVGNFDPMNGDAEEEKKIGEFVSKHYHKVTDEFYDNFNTANIAFDAQLNFLTGLYLGNSDLWPNWNTDLEYRAIRDKSRSEN